MLHRVSSVESAGEQNVEIKIFRVLTPRLATSKLRQIPSSPSATELLALACMRLQTQNNVNTNILNAALL